MVNRCKSRYFLCLLIGALLLVLGPGTAAAKQGGGGPPGGEATGNNLSYPVLWAEGVTKVLRGTPGMVPELSGAWWYWWGTDAEGMPLSCAPDPDEMTYCDDGKVGTYDENDLPGAGAIRVYLQQDALSTWQAGSADWSALPVYVHWVDWGDNLESVDWYTKSMVRTEVVLIEDLTTPMLEYGMRHVSGWGQTEMHGVATYGEPPVAEALDGYQATVYSHCARLTLQKLLVPRENLVPGDLTWVPGEGWVTTDPLADPLINPPIYNMAVHQGGDGPGYYSAEINVKGKIIYGYTWNVRKLNEGAGDYRVTFSFDELCGTAFLNTYFVEGATQILLPTEEELLAAAEEGEEPGGGATAVLDFTDNLTYIDVRILQRGGGGGN